MAISFGYHGGSFVTPQSLFVSSGSSRPWTTLVHYLVCFPVPWSR